MKRFNAKGPKTVEAGRCLALLLFTSMACTAVPGHDRADDYNDAVGVVTISTPMFTPIESSASGDKVLKFGQLRDEQKLAEMIQQPNLAMAYMRYDALRAGLAVSYGGPRVGLLMGLIDAFGYLVAMTFNYFGGSIAQIYGWDAFLVLLLCTCLVAAALVARFMVLEAVPMRARLT